MGSVRYGVVFGLFLFTALPCARAEAQPTCPGQEIMEISRAKILQVIEVQPTPPFVALENSGQTRFIMSSQLLAAILGTSPKALILNDSEELKYISHSLNRSAIFLILSEAKEWSEKKASRVEAVARLQEISISLLWLGPDAAPPSLVELVRGSKGQFLTRDVFLAATDNYLCSTFSP